MAGKAAYSDPGTRRWESAEACGEISTTGQCNEWMTEEASRKNRRRRNRRKRRRRIIVWRLRQMRETTPTSRNEEIV